LTVATASTPAHADAGAAGAQPKPYRVEGGAVDPGSYNGYRRYHATCSHCHGPDGVGGSFGPSLIGAPLPWAEFEAVTLNGKATGNSVMRGFADDPNVAPYIADIYAYLRARADGALGRGRPRRLD
jgi:mono/diheme cytochrome c family protein